MEERVKASRVELAGGVDLMFTFLPALLCRLSILSLFALGIESGIQLQCGRFAVRLDFMAHSSV